MVQKVKINGKPLNSRTLNKLENVQAYFDSWDPKELPEKKRGSFVPSDIIKNQPLASSKPPKKPSRKRTKKISKTVIPKSLKIKYGNERLIDIREELITINRDDRPNAGAVLLRVFFELSVVHYLKRTGVLKKIVSKITGKGSKLPFGIPTLKQLVPDIVRIAKEKLPKEEADKVEKAVTYNKHAPFTISELHGFVHSTDLPSARDIQVFWNRTEPLFRLMLEEDEGGTSE